MSEELWDVLQGRQLPTEAVPIPRDPAGYAAAERDVEAAARALQLAQSRGIVDLAPLVALLETAQAALTAQPVLSFTARCIAADEYEELVAGHPPTDAQRKQGWTWNTATFRPALLAAALEPTLSEHQWHAITAARKIGIGELDLLFATTVNLNTRQPQVSTGKG